MTIIEHISLFQRIVGNMKEDIIEGRTQKAIGKIDILEGELDIMRNVYAEDDSSSDNDNNIVEEGEGLPYLTEDEAEEIE